MSHDIEMGAMAEAKILEDAQRLRAEEFGRYVSRAVAALRAVYSGLGDSIAKARLANQLVDLGEKRLSEFGMSRGDIAAMFSGRPNAGIVNLRPASGAPAKPAGGEQAAA